MIFETSNENKHLITITKYNFTTKKIKDDINIKYKIGNTDKPYNIYNKPLNNNICTFYKSRQLKKKIL